MSRIETDDFRTRIPAGTYVAKTPATVYLSHGTGDSRRDLSYSTYGEGDRIEIPGTESGHWYGLEPNGDMFSPETAAIESAERTGHVVAKGNATDPEFQTFTVREIGGDIYYLNRHVADWCSIPKEWIDKIVWD